MTKLEKEIKKEFEQYSSIPVFIKDLLVASLPKTEEDMFPYLLSTFTNGVKIRDQLLCPNCRTLHPIKYLSHESINLFKKCSHCGNEWIAHNLGDIRFQNIIFSSDSRLEEPTFYSILMVYNFDDEAVAIQIHSYSSTKGNINSFLPINSRYNLFKDINLFNGKELTDSFKKVYKYCGLEFFDEPVLKSVQEIYLLKYCMLYMRYPHIELLIKTKYRGIILDMLKISAESAIKMFELNFKNGRNLKEILMVPDWVHCDSFTLSEYNEARIIYNKYKPSKESFERFFQLNLRKSDFKIFKQILNMKFNGEKLYTFDQLITYLDRCDMFQAISAHDSISILRDYLNMSIQSNIKPITNSGSLKREHDIAARNFQITLSSVQEENFIKKAKELEEYAYENEKLKVIVPKTPKDLILEGQNNNNCIGSYVNSFINGHSKIFFIRWKSNIEQSYVSLEMRGFNVTQAYLSSNRLITNPYTLNFIEEWQNYINEKFNTVARTA